MPRCGGATRRKTAARCRSGDSALETFGHPIVPNSDVVHGNACSFEQTSRHHPLAGDHDQLENLGIVELLADGSQRNIAGMCLSNQFVYKSNRWTLGTPRLSAREPCWLAS
jgi:hypothetical protein